MWSADQDEAPRSRRCDDGTVRHASVSVDNEVRLFKGQKRTDTHSWFERGAGGAARAAGADRGRRCECEKRSIGR